MDDLASQVQDAAGRADVREAVARVYALLQREIDQRRPRCDASGRCCRFEQFGHRLYVTTIELAAFLAHAPQAQEQWDGTGCPFQSGGLCDAHAARPFGCRVFFCDTATQAWQHEQYEHLHAEMKRLHDLLNVPYRYVEWRQALLALGVARAGGASPRGRRVSLPQL